MLVQMEFNNSWSEEKKSCIASLVKERIYLLIGDWKADKISQVTISSNMSDCLTHEIYSVDEQLALCEAPEKGFYLAMHETVLRNMLIPGGGQAYFDDFVCSCRPYLQ